MNTELRKKYKELNLTIKKLYAFYQIEKEDGVEADKLDLIIDKTNELKQEQKTIVNRIKSNIYKKTSCKDLNTYSSKHKNKKQEIKNEKNEDLKKEKNTELFKDARIVFDGKYKLYYDNDSKVLERRLDIYFLNKNSDCDYDYNITTMLLRYDEINGTDLYRRYINNELPVQYDLSKKYGNLGSRDNERLKELAYKSKKNHNNVSIIKEKFSHKVKKALAVTAIGAMTALGMVGLFSKTKNKRNDNEVPVNNNYSTEYVNEDVDNEILSSNESITEASNNIVNNVKLDKEITESHNKISTVENKVFKDIKNSSKTNNDTEKNSFSSVSFNNYVKINDADLYYSSTDRNPIGNTKNLSYKEGLYRMSLISVVYEGQVLEVINYSEDTFNTLKKDCISKYGDSISIFVNFDIVDENENTIYKNVGWINSNELLNKNKVMVK